MKIVKYSRQNLCSQDVPSLPNLYTPGAPSRIQLVDYSTHRSREEITPVQNSQDKVPILPTLLLYSFF